jgi:hypothetical protein
MTNGGKGENVEFGNKWRNWSTPRGPGIAPIVSHIFLSLNFAKEDVISLLRAH